MVLVGPTVLFSSPGIWSVLWIRIQILPSSSNNSIKKSLDFVIFWFVTSLIFLSLKNVNVPSKSNSKKDLQSIFSLFASWRPLWAGSGSRSQLYGSSDPCQNVTEPQHCIWYRIWHEFGLCIEQRMTDICYVKKYLFNTASSAVLQITLCRRMLQMNLTHDSCNVCIGCQTLG